MRFYTASHVPIFDAAPLADLKRIAERANRRIERYQQYTPLYLTHDGMGKKQRDPIGYCGRFFVATFGERNPRPTIIAETFGVLEKYHKAAQRHPRRSIELAGEDLTGVALLGSESPECTLGLLYRYAKAF